MTSRPSQSRPDRPQESVSTIRLPSGEAVPVLGQGTWRMGEHARKRPEEVEALRLGLDLGMTLIDTAEMYGDGGAEEIVAEATAGRRDEIFIVSKVYPQNASRNRMADACDRSLKRLGTDRLDLYLIHWRGSIPLDETVESFERLKEEGKIRGWGVSNFDTPDMEKLVALPSGAAVLTNQVLYNLARRGIEWDLIPWCRRRGIPIMAYSPVDQGRLVKNVGLRNVAKRLDVTPAQVALAWLFQQPDVIVIPKASRVEHVRENRQALDLRLSDTDLRELDEAFPAPARQMPLEMR